MLFSDNVVDLKRQFRHSFREMAILATQLRAFAHGLSKPHVH